jgi:NitT/TauT family transport system substrate-binding protein
MLKGRSGIDERETAMRRLHCLTAYAAAGASLLLTLAACGSGSTDSGSGSAHSLASLTLAFGPVADYLPERVAYEKGYFRDAGLNVKLVTLANGAANIAAVEGGSVGIGGSIMSETAAARNSGVKLEFVGPGDFQAAGHWEIALAVSAKSSATSVKQFLSSGTKTIGVNTLGSTDGSALDKLAQSVGASSSSVKQVAIAFPDMITALEAGHVEGALMTEPFIAQGESAGTIKVLDGAVYSALAPKFFQAGMVATSRWLSQHSAVAKDYESAVEKAVQWIESNPTAAKSILASWTDISTTVAQKVVLPTWGLLSQNVSTVQTTIQAVKDAGLIHSTFPAKDVIFSTG